jgi:hypothetical protein
MRALLILATLLRRLVDPEPTHSRYKPNQSERSLLEGPRVSKASESKKRAQNRRLWRFFRSMTGKYRPSKAQEAWQRQRAKDKVKLVFKTFKGKVDREMDPSRRFHINRGDKLPYKTPLKAAPLNVRGLSGENGITKRQHISQTMKDEKLDVLLWVCPRPRTVQNCPPFINHIPKNHNHIGGNSGHFRGSLRSA